MGGFSRVRKTPANRVYVLDDRAVSRRESDARVEDGCINVGTDWVPLRAPCAEILSTSGRVLRRPARRQKEITAGLIVRDCRLKSREGGAPEFDAVEIGVKPVHGLRQVPHDQIFRVLRHK